MRHKESKPFYHSGPWKAVSRKARDRDQGMCRDCMERFRAGQMNKPRRAELVHHMIPIDERPDLALDLNNLRSLCNICHNRRHPEKGERQNEKNIIPKMRIIKV